MSALTAVIVPCFSDEEVRAIAERPSAAIAAWAQATADALGITVTPTPQDAFIKAVSRLSDGVVDLDPVEQLLIALGRAGVLTSHQQVLLQLHYLR